MAFSGKTLALGAGLTFLGMGTFCAWQSWHRWDENILDGFNPGLPLAILGGALLPLGLFALWCALTKDFEDDTPLPPR